MSTKPDGELVKESIKKREKGMGTDKKEELAFLARLRKRT